MGNTSTKTREDVSKVVVGAFALLWVALMFYLFSQTILAIDDVTKSLQYRLDQQRVEIDEIIRKVRRNEETLTTLELHVQEIFGRLEELEKYKETQEYVGQIKFTAGILFLGVLAIALSTCFGIPSTVSSASEKKKVKGS